MYALTVAMTTFIRFAQDQTSQHSSKEGKEPQKLPPSAEKHLTIDGFWGWENQSFIFIFIFLRVWPLPVEHAPSNEHI